MNGGVERSWELTKENIQPLPTGRRMECLEGSLPVRSATGFNDQHQYEEYHLNEIRKLEKNAEKNEGDDPLQIWVDLVRYIEQHFPTMNPTVKGLYNKLIKKTVQKFYTDERYTNDKRFGHFYLMAVEFAPRDYQYKMLNDFLSGGHCTQVCDIYLYLADKYDQDGDTRKAIEILQEGVNNGAEPKQLLEEMKTNIQDRFAARYAKQLADGVSPEEVGGRTFASSVPVVGENNEAISIRQNLLPAAPANSSKPKSGPNGSARKVPIYQDGTPSSIDTENRLPRAASVNSKNGAKLANMEPSGVDAENRLEAGRWNNDHANLHNPVIPEPPERIQLYVEPDVSTRSSTMKPPPPPISKNVLKEIKKDKEDSDAQGVPVPNGSLRSTSNSAPTDDEIKKQHRLEQEVKRRRAAQRLDYDDNDEIIFNENIKYKEIPKSGLMNRLFINEAKHWEYHEKELQKLKDTLCLRREVCQLREENSCLKSQSEERQKLFDLKLQQKEEKIKSLEAHSEDLMNKLTKITTDNNLRETFYHRERSNFEQQIEKLQMQLSNEKQLYEKTLSTMESKIESLEKQLLDQASALSVQTAAPPDYDSESRGSERMESVRKDVTLYTNTVAMDISCSQTKSCENMSSDGSSEGSAETSKFGSGESTVAGNSFMPCIENSINVSKNVSQTHVQPKRVLAMVERHAATDEMNVTPAAVPTEFDLIPPPSFGFGALKKKGLSSQPMRLYESISADSFSQPKTAKSGSFSSTKRTHEMKNLQLLSENMPPPKAPTLTDENAIPLRPPQPSFPYPTYQNMEEPSFEPDPGYFGNLKDKDNDNFVKPGLPVMRRTLPSLSSDENAPAPPSMRNENEHTQDSTRDSNLDIRKRLSILSKRPLTCRDGSSSDEEEEIIVRRHQQTGVDLNISNLTTVLSLAPKPLTNSTPEREKTLRDIKMAPLAFAEQLQELEDAAAQDYQGNIPRLPRHTSVLNDPPLNLSTIQETSRENRSRSTTSSSSGGMTMSTTRFGMVASTTQGHISYNNVRSSSVPRSGSRTSNNNTNFGYSGYYSDTNMK